MNIALLISIAIKITIYFIILYYTIKHKDKGWTLVATTLLLINFINIFKPDFQLALSGVSAGLLAYQIIKTVRRNPPTGKWIS
jgi:hypothetical protein